MMASNCGALPGQGTANAYKRFTYMVEVDQVGQRLDRVVAALHPGLTRTAAEQLILEGHVLLNGRAAKPSARVTHGANVAVSVPPPPASEAQPEDIPLDVVYEDHTLVVVNKAAGMVVHPAPGNERGTLVNALLGRYAALPGDPMRPGIVHRLDKDTSGLIVVARDPAAVAALADAFKRREVHKEYLALLVGSMRPPDGTIRAAIGRDPRLRQRMAVVATGGREARTAYRTEEVFRGYSLVRVVLETGRMHQIRVHFTAAGHPVAGDPVYGRAARGLGLRRQFLHAARLRFRHPVTGEELDLEAPLPDDLQRVLDTLRGAGGDAAQG
jgi:23S rRNA pseudouridine1911/1915/1917 synthase